MGVPSPLTLVRRWRWVTPVVVCRGKVSIRKRIGLSRNGADPHRWFVPHLGCEEEAVESGPLSARQFELVKPGG